MKDLIWIEISKNAVIKNLKQLRKIVGDDVVLSVAVKANAYGHGIKGISKLLVENGSDWLSVNSIERSGNFKEQ